MSDPAPAIVVGAGYTGRRLIAHLGRLGHPVLAALSRTPSDAVVNFDLDSSDELPVDLAVPYSVVYTVPPKGRRLVHLLERLLKPPQRFVYLSTTGVYGDRGGKCVDEYVEIAPTTDRANRRSADEQTLVEWCAKRDVVPVILRVPGIYGPDRLGLERIRSGAPVLREQDANPGNRIHVVDLVACCVAALAASTPSGIYNVGDGDERSSTWFAMEVSRQAGLSPPPTVSLEQAKQTFSERRLSFLCESRRLNLDRMHDVLGVVPNYGDAAEGIAASLGSDLGSDQ